MTFAQIKAVQVEPYDGKPIWSGWYLDHRQDWRRVRNQHGNPIAYAIEAAALLAAAEARERSLKALHPAATALLFLWDPTA